MRIITDPESAIEELTRLNKDIEQLKAALEDIESVLRTNGLGRMYVVSDRASFIAGKALRILTRSQKEKE